MSKKYSNTTADYLSWDEMLNLVRKLFNDGKFSMSLLICLGSFWGLRISDLLMLQWEQILNQEQITIIEKKTKKVRVIPINGNLQKYITECYQKIKPLTIKEHVFRSQKGCPYSVQRVNVIFKEIKAKYNLNVENFSTHSNRKTFGRQVLKVSGENKEMGMLKLMHLFNHSNMNITKRYLNLRSEELKEVYSNLTF